jgi:hypothetical protein
MAWQDMVFLVGNLVLGAVLIPTLLDENVEIPLKTSVPTALVLSIFAASYFTLELYFSAVSTAVIAAMWLYIAEFRNSRFSGEK